MIHRLIYGALGALSLTACRQPEVTAYTIAREEPASIAGASSAPAVSTPPVSAPAVVPPAEADGSPLAWTTPPHWQEKPASPARLASLAVRGPDGAEAELAITTFPGDVGGEFANVNRWRGQVGLPPAAAAEVAGLVTRLEHNGLQFAVVDLPGGTQRLLGAIVPHGSHTWFFKLLGPEAVVAAEKPVFLNFLQSVRVP